MKITLFTECSIQNMVYQAHCSYKGEGPRYDFAMICWTKDGSEDCKVATLPALQPHELPEVYLNHHYAPVKLVEFFQSENLSIPYCV